ncbi:MAG: hypothetical protein ABIH23_13445 [bacterium]
MKDISAALFPGTKRKILALFFLNPDQEYYFSEVVRLTGTRQGVIQRELKSLTDAEILTWEKRGRQKFYAVNRKHPIFQDLRNIIFKTYGVIGKIREALEPLGEKINVAFVYGSFARGEEVSGSDLDLSLSSAPPDLMRLSAPFLRWNRPLGARLTPLSFQQQSSRISGQRRTIF